MPFLKITFLLFFLSTIIVFSQEDITKEEDLILNELLGEDTLIEELLQEPIEFNMLSATVNYNSNTFFAGRDIGVAQFNIVPEISYMHSVGVFASILGQYYSEFTPKWDFTALRLGYGKNFGEAKKHRYSVSYTRYFYTAEVENPFENSLTLGWSYTNSTKKLGFGFPVTYLFGSANSYQINPTFWYSTTLYKKKKNEFKITPQVAFLIGQQTVEQAQVLQLGTREVTLYQENENFGLLNAQIHFPIQYAYKALDVELGYTVNIPFALPGETDVNVNGFLNFSVAYMLVFN